jgi:hypothetical protein
MKIITCALCGKISEEEERPKEEMLQEYIDTFGAFVAISDPIPEMVCDNCFNEFHPDKYPDKLQALKEELLKRQSS